MKKYIISALIILFIAASVGTVYADELERLIQEQQEVQRQIEEETRNLRGVQQYANTLAGQLRRLESEIAAVERELAALNRDLRIAEMQVDSAERELEEVERELQEKIDIFSQRLVHIYQRGDVSFFEVITQSASLTDFLVRFELLKKIAEQDIRMVEEIEMKRLAAEAIKEDLKERRDQVASLKQQTEATYARLAAQRREQQDYLARINYNAAYIYRMLRELEEDSRRMTAQIRQIQVSLHGLTGFDGKLAWPTPGHYRITSDFGMRNHPVLGGQRMHTGIDIGVPHGRPVVAGEIGEVIFAGWFGGYGLTVVLYHGGGMSTLYAHLSSISVNERDLVGRGEQIGRIGSTGLSTGPHKHFEVREDGNPVNPWPFLR